MIQWLISRRYYLLTSLTLLLGTLVLVVTLALATASYLRSIDKTVAGYGHMLSSLDAALIHELVLANQRVYGSDKQILTLIKRVLGLDGQLLGLLMVDMSFNAIQQALQRAMGRNQAAIYISSRGGEQLVVGCNMALYQPPVTTAGVVGSGLEVIWHGRHLRRELEGIDWDLNIYLPPELFHDGLEEALLMVVLPLLSLFAIWFCSINFLVRVFNQEQALVAGSLTGIVRDPTQTPCQLKTWFVHSSLSEIDQVRASFLQGQDALLHDLLTGIMNRRAFTPAASMTTGGTRWGDGVLCRVAELLVAELGSSCVYRIGGDEFAALLPWPRSELEAGLTRLLAREYPMEMNKRGMSALALLGSLLLVSGVAQASETLNTILGGGAGGVAGTMIGKELGGDTGALVGAALGGAAGGAATANKGNKNEAALGGAVGALGGAAIGKSVGGSTGQLIGAGVGGASGSAIGAKTGDGHKSNNDRYYDDEHRHHKKHKKHKKHRWHDDD
ncbi:UNVERIFIED_CONTAM: hypothetical protein K2H54_000028 [Gekko kuhli]